MLDIASTRVPTPAPPPNSPDPFFYSVALSRQADGNIFVELSATMVDEEGPSLINQEIVSDRVATIDDVLALIRTHVRIA